MGRFATGVTVLTVNGPGDRPLGMTASSLASVSLVPPLVSVCVDHEAELHDAILAAPVFVVNILESGQEVLSRRFADRHEDRFDGVGYHRSPEGLVLLDGALAHIECERFARLPRRRPHHHHRPGDRRLDRRGPAAALLPRRLRHARMTGRAAAGRARSGTELLDDPAADPGGVVRVAPQHRARQPLVRRRGRGALRAGAGCFAASRAAGRSRCSTSAPAPATCRARAVAWARAARLRPAAARTGAEPDRRGAGAAGRRPLRGRLRRRAADPGEVGGPRAGEPGGAPLRPRSAVRLFRTCDALARVGRGGRRSAARSRSAPLAFRVGARALRFDRDHRRRRHHLASAGATPPRELRALLAARRRAGRVSRRPGYRLVATWRTGGEATGRWPGEDRRSDPHARADRRVLRRRRRRRALARAAAPLPLGAHAGAAAGRRAGGDGRLAAVRPAQLSRPGGSRRCGSTAPRRRCTTATSAASPPAWTWSGGSCRRATAPTSPSCTSGPARAGR